jgi:hypothetical protein
VVPHIDRLAKHLRDKTTYELLVGYDERIAPEEMFTQGQLEYCVEQCSALHDYLQEVVLHNSGERGSGWTQEECANSAATRTYGKVSGITIMRCGDL